MSSLGNRLDNGANEISSPSRLPVRASEVNFQRSIVHADDAATLSAAIVQQGPLNAGRKNLLTWLIQSADSSKQVATTRAKAVKALASVAETDPRVLTSSVMQSGVNNALQV